MTISELMDIADGKIIVSENRSYEFPFVTIDTGQGLGSDFEDVFTEEFLQREIVSIRAVKNKLEVILGDEQ